MIKKGDTVRVTAGDKKRFIGTVESVKSGVATVKLFHNDTIITKPVEELTKHEREEA